MSESDEQKADKQKLESEQAKDFRVEADQELEQIKRDADKANRDIEEVVEKGNEQGD